MSGMGYPKRTIAQMFFVSSCNILGILKSCEKVNSTICYKENIVVPLWIVKRRCKKKNTIHHDPVYMILYFCLYFVSLCK
jgi:hypothetical protein